MKLESTDKPAVSTATELDDLVLAVINKQAQGIVVLDNRGNVVLWNDWMGDWTGLPSSQAIGSHFETLIPAIIGEEYSRAIKVAIDSGQSTAWSLDLDPRGLDNIEAAMTRGDRLLPLSRANVTPLTVNSKQGCLLEFAEAPFSPLSSQLPGASRLPDTATVQTSTAQATTAQASTTRTTPQTETNGLVDPQTAGEPFAVYLASSETAVLSLDTAGIIQDVNDHLLKQTGYSRQQLLDTPVRMLFPTLSENFDIEDYRALVHTRVNQNRERVMEAATVNGELRTFRITIYPSAVRDDIFVLLCEDFSSQSGARDTIKRQREMLATVFNQVADGIALLDCEGLIEQINPVGLTMLGMRAGQVENLPVESIIKMFDEQGKAVEPCRQALNRGSPCSTPEHTFLQVQGQEPVSVSATATPLRNQHNSLIACVLVYRIIEESRRVSSRLSWQSDHDPLTQLPNRRYLENQLVKAIEEARTSNQLHALLYIDLHNFSLVNDTTGRVGGDTLLLECGKLLQQIVGVDHLVARIGNDEFAILLHHCPVKQAREISEEILSGIKAFSFPWEERRLKIGVNIGAEIIDRDTSSEIDVLVTAAASCAAAKANGRNRVFFRQQRDEGMLAKKVGEWVPKINDALEQDRFCLYYQPIVPVGGLTKSYQHFEALVRMVDEAGQLVSPGKFIPAAELYGLIDDIDRWVVKRVITELGSKRLRKRPDLRISVNLSGATVGDERFKDYLLELIETAGINPHQLQFEITETSAVRHFDRALDLIHALKAKGCYFSLDDFGSGVSSFGYLKELPVDVLKIDGSFVRNIELNDIEYSMVSTINHLASIMGIETVAECVESQAQLTLLEQIGIDYAQGFFIAMPQPLEKFFP